ncbi:MAG: hypothetical protein ACI9CE_002914 [Flavobacterium sp.]|jgi:hypothetical protein
MRKLNRREFLQISSALGLSVAAPLISRNVQAEELSGDLVLHLKVLGGWDVSSFCDPKLNTNGESVINNWATGLSEIPKAGNIPYAPVWDNASFFEKYYRDMLVINCIDAQTNSHTAGEIGTFSGRISPGFPTITASVAGVFGPTLAMSYINNASYKGTGGIVSVTQISNPETIPRLANSNSVEHDYDQKIFSPEVFDTLQSAKLARIERQLAASNLFPRHRNALSQLFLATDNVKSLSRINDFLPDELINDRDDQGFHPSWRQAEIAMVAYKAGLTLGVDLGQGDGFDTHAKHDSSHEPIMRRLVRDIDTIWQLSEKHGITDRVTLIINSEFARTPYYNGDSGKDHWPIASTIIMKNGAPWGNRVVGRTDEIQNGIKINPVTLEIDETNGSLIYSQDLMMALRRHFGVADHPSIAKFDLNVEREFDFFNPELSTVQLYS